jgi:hypothetical protein
VCHVQVVVVIVVVCCVVVVSVVVNNKLYIYIFILSILLFNYIVLFKYIIKLVATDCNRFYTSF